MWEYVSKKIPLDWQGSLLLPISKRTRKNYYIDPLSVLLNKEKKVSFFIPHFSFFFSISVTHPLPKSSVKNH